MQPMLLTSDFRLQFLLVSPSVSAATVKMNRLSHERAVDRKLSPLITGDTSKTNVLMNGENMFTTLPPITTSSMRTTSFNKSSVQVAAVTATTVALSTTHHDVSTQEDKRLAIHMNKSTILITDESLKNFKTTLTDESLHDNHRRNHDASAASTGLLAGGMTSDTTTALARANSSSKYNVSSVSFDSDIDFLTDGDIMCPVKCNSIGSMVPIACDSLSRHCRCKAGVTGVQCDRCQVNHWGFHLIVDENGSCKREYSPLIATLPFTDIAESLSPLSLTACNCNPIGSLRSECSQSTGDCQCKAGVFGSKCDSCRPGEMLSESGCIPSVTDDYNRLESSDITGTSITSSTVPRVSLSNIDDDTVKLNSFDDAAVNVSKKKRKKGLGKKKNRKRKKAKAARLEETPLPQ